MADSQGWLKNLDLLCILAAEAAQAGWTPRRTVLLS